MVFTIRILAYELLGGVNVGLTFIALIFISYIKQQMDKKGLFKKYTLQEVLDELDIIERFTQPNKKSIVGEVTKKQKELYQLLGVEAIS